MLVVVYDFASALCAVAHDFGVYAYQVGDSLLLAGSQHWCHDLRFWQQAGVSFLHFLVQINHDTIPEF